MDNAKINQQHINDICADCPEVYHPGMPEASANTLVQLRGEPQNI